MMTYNEPQPGPLKDIVQALGVSWRRGTDPVQATINDGVRFVFHVGVGVRDRRPAIGDLDLRPNRR